MQRLLEYDGIVFSLQRVGGISVLFSELISRLPRESYTLVGYQEQPPDGLTGSTYIHRRPRRMERYRPSLVDSNSGLFHSTYYRLPAQPGPKVVTTVYDFIYERSAPLAPRLVHGWQKRAAIRGADRIICISESTRCDLLDFMGPEYAERSVVVPLAAADAYRPLADEAHQPQVLFVGTRAGFKNFPAVVEALAPLRDLSLLCVGGGDFTADERALLERNLRGRYRSAGYLTVEQLNVEYNRSLCLTYPSLFEGFGIPVLEAMQAGCPVVAVRASSIPEVAGDAAILLERGNAEEIRLAVERIGLSADRALMVARGRARAALFTWDETYRRTIAVYEELLGRSPV